MANETPADLVAEAKDLETKLEGLASDSGAPSEATKPAEDPAGQAPAEASAAAPDAKEAPVESAPKAPEGEPEKAAEPAEAPKPEFKDSVGNVFDGEGRFLRREDGFGGLESRR